MTMTTSSMKYEKCQLHNEPSSFVCTYDECDGLIICKLCTKEHFKHNEYIMSFDILEEKYRTDRLKYLNVAVSQTMKQLMEDVKNKSGLHEWGKLEDGIEKCQNFIRQKIEDKIMKEVNKMITALQQKKKELPTFMTNHFDAGQPAKKIEEIIKQLKDEQEIVMSFDKEIRKTKNELENYVIRGLQQINQLNNQIKIITDIVIMRRNELGKSLDSDFKMVDRAQQKKFNSQFNTSDLKGKSDEMRYETIKKITWQNQRLENELQRTKLRLGRQDNKMLQRNNQFVQLQSKMHTVQVQLAKLKQELKKIKQAQQREIIRKMQDQKKQKYQFQTMLVKKGVQNYINPTVLNLRGKGITQTQLKMIIKQLVTLTSLDLSQNNIEIQTLQQIFKLQQVKSLKLSFMKVNQAFISLIAGNYKNSLIELHLDSNGLTDENINEIVLLKNLEILSLIDNFITDIGAIKIANRIANIKKLYLSYNKITSKSVQDISKNLFTMTDLRLTRNSIKNKGLHNIAMNLKQLQQLHVGGCQFSKQGAVYLAKGCPKLKRLSVGNNMLQTDSIIQIIMYLPNLTMLQISYCQIDAQGLQKIKKVSKMNDKLHLIYQQ